MPHWRKVFSLSLHQWLDGGFGGNNNFTWINYFGSVETEASNKYLTEYKRTIDRFACPDKNRGKLTIISKYRYWNSAKSAANALFCFENPLFEHRLVSQRVLTCVLYTIVRYDGVVLKHILNYIYWVKYSAICLKKDSWAIEVYHKPQTF